MSVWLPAFDLGWGTLHREHLGRSHHRRRRHFLTSPQPTISGRARNGCKTASGGLEEIELEKVDEHTD